MKIHKQINDCCIIYFVMVMITKYKYSFPNLKLYAFDCSLQFVLTIKNNYTKILILYFITIYANKIIVYMINDTITNYS